MIARSSYKPVTGLTKPAIRDSNIHAILTAGGRHVFEVVSARKLRYSKDSLKNAMLRLLKKDPDARRAQQSRGAFFSSLPE